MECFRVYILLQIGIMLVTLQQNVQGRAMSDTYTTRYTLLTRAKDQHDSKAWEEFIEVYKNFIYIVIHSMNIDEHDLQDIMQQVVLKLWKALPSYAFAPEQHKFRNWVYCITRNEVVSFIRRQRALSSKMEIAAQEATTSYLSSIQLPEVDYTAEREWKIFITNIAMQRIEKCFTSAAVKAFEMRSSGMNVADIAVELDVKEDSVYRYVSRIKSRLIKEITQLKKDYSL